MVNVRVEVYNVNYTEHAEVQTALIERSQSLKEYSQFVHQLQQSKQKGKSIEEALREAMDYCMERDIMRGFLEKHGSEVRNMLFTEWNWDDAYRIAREEAMEIGMEHGLEEGRKQGIAQGIEQGIEQGIAQGKREAIQESIYILKDVVPPDVLAEKFELPLAEVLRILETDSMPVQSKE